jgi:hypothetical protein
MQLATPTYLPRHVKQSFPLPVRITGLLMVFSLTTLLVMGELTLLAAQTPHNPFVEYAPLMPGQMAKAAIERGFACAPAYIGATCVTKPSAGLLFEVYLSLSSDHVIQSASFVTRNDTLKFGDLAALWGSPTCEMRGSLVVIVCWRGVYALVPLNGNGEFDYFSPVKLLEFSDYSDKVCDSALET